MYTDDDLNLAIEKGIFTDNAVTEFRKQMLLSKDVPSADEEAVRLVSGFNDIFVVIACSLLLISSAWVLHDFSKIVALITMPVLAWGLAEFFVLKRKQALPAIVLLLTFVGGVFVLGEYLFQFLSESSVIASTAATVVAAYLHWRRFKVPITIAAGTAATIGFVVATFISTFTASKEMIFVMIFLCGVISFLFAMYWDSLDRSRKTRRSDVAFWLHLLSAPLIVHPVFSVLGILDGNQAIESMVVVILLYLVMTLISIVTDRRAFMVSSLVYVLYALSNLLKEYGSVGYSFALTGVCIGAALLLLAAFWRSSRAVLVPILPISIQKYIPEVRSN